MAVLGNKFIDLRDIYKLQNANGDYVQIIEMLMEQNPILTDAITLECNKGATHTHTIRTGLPGVSWGELYKGIEQSKSSTAQVTDTTGFVEALSTVDVRLLELAKDEGKVRLSEAMSFLEAMNQEVSRKIFYGNSATDPKEFMGLAPRFSDLSAPNGNQIIDAGGRNSENTSIWFITWDEQTCHLLYPEGTNAGIDRKDHGRQRVNDNDGNPFYAKEETFRWHVGLTVKDWRYISRIANIDTNSLKTNAVDLYKHMRSAYYKLQNRRAPNGGTLAIYCNREVLESLDALATNSGNSDNFTRLKHKEIQGEEVLTYRGIPIRETDSLVNTEETVS